MSYWFYFFVSSSSLFCRILIILWSTSYVVKKEGISWTGGGICSHSGMTLSVYCSWGVMSDTRVLLVVFMTCLDSYFSPPTHPRSSGPCCDTNSCSCMLESWWRQPEAPAHCHGSTSSCRERSHRCCHPTRGGTWHAVLARGCWIPLSGWSEVKWAESIVD